MAWTELVNLPAVLLPWYMENKRDLPWRRTKDPYPVWLSEIMLQQTRVEAVKGYFARFLREVPDIAALAGCDDEALHKLWEGLGYYSRVRNLKKAAKVVDSEYGGVFPREYSAVRALPGIGDYTAGAICSICYDLPTPAVDGNVLRVITRLTEDATPIDQPAFKNRVREELAAVYPEQAGDFTQALMELGATVCGPNGKPDCKNCPCRDFCKGHLRGTAEHFPVRPEKKAKKQEDMTVLILSCDGSYALRKRESTGLLAGLWEFPHVPGKLETPEVLLTLETMGLRPKELYRQVDKKHIFTHIQWNMRGYYLELSEPGGDFNWLTPERIREEAALPTAFRQFWEQEAL